MDKRSIAHVPSQSGSITLDHLFEAQHESESLLVGFLPEWFDTCVGALVRKGDLKGLTPRAS